MRELLLTPTPLFRKLRQLTLLLSLLLVPQLAGAVDYDLWIGTVRVTDANKDNILAGDATNDGKLIYTPSQTTSGGILTLKGVTLTSAISTGNNLVIVVEGTNTISTNGDPTIIGNSSNKPNITFRSNSNSEGNLKLSNTGSNGVMSSSEYFGTITIDKTLALISPTSSYYLTDGTTLLAQFEPSYEVGIGDIMIYAGNASDVLGDGKVSFDKDNHLLTLNSADLSGEIKCSLPLLDIDLQGNNTLNLYYDGAAFVSPYGDDVAISFKSTSTTTGTLSILLNHSSTGILGDDVTVTSYTNDLEASDALNNSNILYAVIGKYKDYGLTVDGVGVTTRNSNNVLNDNETYHKVTYVHNYSNNTGKLTLRLATLTTGIANSGLDGLTINFNGTGNTINAATAISSTNGGTLDFTKSWGDGGLAITASTSAVSGFSSVTLADNLYYEYNTPFTYSSSLKLFQEQISARNTVKNLTISNSPHYPLWIGSTQFTNNTTSISGVSFNPGTTNTLALSDADLSNNYIVSGLDNLTITLEGDNKITMTDSSAVIRTFNLGATLTIQKAGTSDCSLYLENGTGSDASPVVKHFASVSYGDLNFVSKTGSTLDASTTHDAFLSSSTLYPLWVAGTLVTGNKTSGTGTNGTWEYDASSNTLTLTNYENTNNTGHAFICNMANLNVYLVGTNTVGPGDGVYGVQGFYTTYQNARLTFCTNKSSIGALNASSFGLFSDGYSTDSIYCKDGLGYFPSSKMIKAKATPTITFYKRYQTGTDAGDVISPADVVSDTQTTTYGSTYYAPEPTFLYPTDGEFLGDSTRYVYSYTEDGIVEFPISSTDATTGKIYYGDIQLKKSGEVTIICRFPGNITYNPCEASYTLKIDKGNATFEYREGTTAVTTSDSYIDVDGNGQWGAPGTTGGTAPTLSKPNDLTGTITFSSSDDNVATIDATGIVTPIGKGSTTITASLDGDDNYNNTSASYTLSVKEPATIKFTNATASVLNTESYTQNAIVTPTGATVVYSPSNTNVSVDADGKVTPNNTYVGKVTITARISAIPNANPQYYYFIDGDTHFQASYELTVSKVFNNVTFASGQSYATYCNTDADDLTLPEGITAYAVRVPTSGNYVEMEGIDFLPGNSTGYYTVLLKRDATSRSSFGTVTKYERKPTDNPPVNHLHFTTAGKDTDGRQYILYNDEFVKATGTIRAPYGYLESPNANPARGFMIGDGNDGSTAIDATLLDDGEANHDEWYDLQGRRIAKPTKAGLYIKNGKKMVINNK